MKNESIRFEIVERKKNLPFVICTHTREMIMQEGVVGEDGKLAVPHLRDHWHTDLEFNYLFSGSCEYFIEGKGVVLEEGRILVINPGDVHSILVDLDKFDEVAMGFTLLVEERFLKEVFPDFEKICFSQEDVQKDEKAKELLLSLYRVYIDKGENHKELLLMGMLYNFLYELCTAGCVKERSLTERSFKNKNRLRQILTFVEEHYTETITLSDTAARFYFSRGYFAGFFKSCTGMTFMEYVTRFRLNKALEIMMTEDLSITESAMQSGFSDTRSFIHAFHKYFGTTPAQYKRDHRQAIQRKAI